LIQLGLKESGYIRKEKVTHQQQFLQEMDCVVPWAEMEKRIAPYYDKTGAKGGRPPIRIGILLRIHFLQQWFGLSDPGMEEKLYEVPSMCVFAGIDRSLMDANSGLVHTVIGTAANVHDVTQAAELLHGEETYALCDAGYQGVQKRPEHESTDTFWITAMRPGTVRALPDNPQGNIARRLEKIKAGIRAKVEHPFRLIKCQFGHIKVRYRGLAKNTAQLITLFALSNLWMARKHLTGATA
jgi:IS5 family transposase